MGKPKKDKKKDKEITIEQWRESIRKACIMAELEEDEKRFIAMRLIGAPIHLEEKEMIKKTLTILKKLGFIDGRGDLNSTILRR